MTTPPSLPKDGEFCQLFCFRIDMVGSEKTARDIGAPGMAALLEVSHKVVEDVVVAAGGNVGGWQGDGAVAFFASTGDESELIRRGEASARRTIDELGKKLPERRFRIGAATGRGRFRAALGQISEDCVVLAARLESEAKKRVDGSALLLPADIHSVLDDGARKLYQAAGERGELKLFVYCPEGSRPIPQERSSSNTPEIVGGGELGFEMIDPWWPWAGKSDFYYAFATTPADKLAYDREKHKEWVQQHYLSLPIGSIHFLNESLRDGWLLYYAADREGGAPIQAFRVMRPGTLIFGDAGLPRLGRGWTSGFYPQAMLKPLNQFLEFAQGYYTEAHRYSGRIFVRVGIINVVGRDRVLGEGIVGVAPWKYDRDIIVGGQFPAPELASRSTLKILYDQVILESELDPGKFGLSAKKNKEG